MLTPKLKELKEMLYRIFFYLKHGLKKVPPESLKHLWGGSYSPHPQMKIPFFKKIWWPLTSFKSVFQKFR